jgi:citrate lyase gamma subunit
LKPETIRRLQQSMMARYPGSNIGVIMSSWIEKQYVRAVESTLLQSLTSQSLKKVPVERIYVYDGGVTKKPLILRENKTLIAPITLIVRNADLVIE